jgi:glucokinase
MSSWPEGAPAQLLPLNGSKGEDQLSALGIDIGGSRTKIGLVDPSGQILDLSEFSTRVEPRETHIFLGELLGETRKVLQKAAGRVLGIGITFLGWINEEKTGPYFCMNAPALHNFNFKSLMESAFALPVVVHDDVTAHTMAEYTFGCGRDCRRFMCLAMGTGLGASMIVDGVPLQFTGGCAGDTGHILLRPGGPECSAGCKGCAEALIGVAGIERLAWEKYQLAKTAPEIIREAATAVDPLATAVMQEIGGYTGELLASLFPIFVPERVALVGGTTRAGEVLLGAARERFDDLMGKYCRSYENISAKHFSKDEIVLGELRGETGVIGAVIDLLRQDNR